jgi:hypothetical protein
VALLRVTSTVARDAATLLVLRDLAEKVRRDRRISDMAPGDLDVLKLQCCLINPGMDLVPAPPLGAAVIGGMPAYSISVSREIWLIN